MSLYHGLLLFDIAEPSVNGWEEDLGTRGMYEQWRKGNMRFLIDINEDAPEGKRALMKEMKRK